MSSWGWWMFYSNHLHTLDRPCDCNQSLHNGLLADTVRTESAAWCRVVSVSPIKLATADCRPASADHCRLQSRAFWLCWRSCRGLARTSSGASDWCHDTSSCCHDIWAELSRARRWWKAPRTRCKWARRTRARRCPSWDCAATQCTGCDRSWVRRGSFHTWKPRSTVESDYFRAAPSRSFWGGGRRAGAEVEWRELHRAAARKHNPSRSMYPKTETVEKRFKTWRFQKIFTRSYKSHG